MITGILRHLQPALGADVVQYRLQVGEKLISLNPLIGAPVRIIFEGEKRCIHCNRKCTRLFNNGYCWPCFQRLACNDICQVKPSLCHYKTCREPTWGDEHCMIPTWVYLAKSSDIKVGITRNLPGRWLDQGAVEAVPIALVPTRKVAGDLELFLSQYLPDKTNWRRMLKGEVTAESILAVRSRVLGLIPEAYRPYVLTDQPVRHFRYPVAGVPDRITACDPEKAPVEGKLLGIKGSYLILSSGVVNVPKFTGYVISFQGGEENPPD